MDFIFDDDLYQVMLAVVAKWQQLALPLSDKRSDLHSLYARLKMVDDKRCEKRVHIYDERDLSAFIYALCKELRYLIALYKSVTPSSFDINKGIGDVNYFPHSFITEDKDDVWCEKYSEQKSICESHQRIASTFKDEMDLLENGGKIVSNEKNHINDERKEKTIDYVAKTLVTENDTDLPFRYEAIILKGDNKSYLYRIINHAVDYYYKYFFHKFPIFNKECLRNYLNGFKGCDYNGFTKDHSLDYEEKEEKDSGVLKLIFTYIVDKKDNLVTLKRILDASVDYYYENKINEKDMERN